jgi:hypothetical protein
LQVALADGRHVALAAATDSFDRADRAERLRQ